MAVRAHAALAGTLAALVGTPAAPADGCGRTCFPLLPRIRSFLRGAAWAPVCPAVCPWALRPEALLCTSSLLWPSAVLSVQVLWREPSVQCGCE